LEWFIFKIKKNEKVQKNKKNLACPMPSFFLGEPQKRTGSSCFYLRRREVAQFLGKTGPENLTSARLIEGNRPKTHTRNST
jgi:hypothetical protein